MVVRHLGAGVLGANAPAPFQKDSLKQTIYWDGKDDLGWYVKEPDKLQIRVMLGLKPVFDKRLGGTSPYNLPGYVWGLATEPDGAYIFSQGQLGRHTFLRKFDHDGKYIASLLPPPANLPESKLNGMIFVEYEKGKRSLLGPHIDGGRLDAHHLPFDGIRLFVPENQPVISGNRIYTCYEGAEGHNKTTPPTLHYLYTDGSTDLTGIRGLFLRDDGVVPNARLACSPDGKKIYIAGFVPARAGGGKAMSTCVLVKTIDSDGPAEIFVGDPRMPGNDNKHFNGVAGIDCDTQGRVYVADKMNNRIQIFSPEGKFIKSITIDRPLLVCVHKKSGAIYVQHETGVEGKSISRLTKFASLDNPKPVAHQDGLHGLMALDLWSSVPRVWVSGTFNRSYLNVSVRQEGFSNLTVWEERQNGFVKILDFDEEAKKQDGAFYFGRWAGGLVVGVSQVTCDPNTERVYHFQAADYWNEGQPQNSIFDLKTGKFIGRFSTLASRTEDIAFDKYGYMHGHTGCRTYGAPPCVWRADPKRTREPPKRIKLPPNTLFYPEVPYDYGEEIPTDREEKWKGALPVKDQPGAKSFQDGLGVNMRGDIAVESNIYYIPKMEEAGYEIAFAGVEARRQAGIFVDRGNYQTFLKDIMKLEKKGEAIYFIRREPGIPLAGATIWTYNRSGQLRQECAVIMRWIINGVQIDEDGSLYFVNASPRILNPDDGYFLCGKSFRLGAPQDKTVPSPFTGTLIKTSAKTVRLRMAQAPVPMERLPERKPDVMCTHYPWSYGKNAWGWVEGADWLYAGVSPLQPVGCSCAVLRIHLDWYKRVYVPEAYRHSFGILDTNGNLIMHFGQYGNFDSGSGPNSKIPVGDDNITVATPRFISGTDNYIVFEDLGERLVVLRIEYHKEESVAMSNL